MPAAPVPDRGRPAGRRLIEGNVPAPLVCGQHVLDLRVVPHGVVKHPDTRTTGVKRRVRPRRPDHADPQNPGVPEPTPQPAPALHPRIAVAGLSGKRPQQFGVAGTGRACRRGGVSRQLLVIRLDTADGMKQNGERCGECQGAAGPIGANTISARCVTLIRQPPRRPEQGGRRTRWSSPPGRVPPPTPGRPPSRARAKGPFRTRSPSSASQSPASGGPGRTPE